MPKKSSKLNFEDSLSKLEEIIESMENDQLSLDELLGQYEDGTRLYRQCESYLGQAKKRLITLNQAPADEPSTSIDTTTTDNNELF